MSSTYILLPAGLAAVSSSAAHFMGRLITAAISGRERENKKELRNADDLIALLGISLKPPTTT
jgi:hypothetical protein